ncbi:helix-turn-helix domain-containing protein [Nonomuraea sp. NPDC002799]
MNEKEIDPTASPEAAFGYELRKRRKEAGLTLEQLAAKVNVSRPSVGAYEKGTRSVSEAMASRLEEVMGLEPGQLVERLPVGRRASLFKSFVPWLAVEQRASKLRTWQSTFVPGLLQIPGYAEAIIRGKPGVTEGQVCEAVKARMDRQKIFRVENPPRLWAILDESILYRPIGSVEITRSQLEHLVEIGQRPWATIQIIPYSAMSTSGLPGGWTIAQANGLPDAAYVDSPLRGQLCEDPADVELLRLRYETARDEALPASRSLRRIEERLGQAWNWD